MKTKHYLILLGVIGVLVVGLLSGFLKESLGGLAALVGLSFFGEKKTKKEKLATLDEKVDNKKKELAKIIEEGKKPSEDLSPKEEIDYWKKQ